MKTYLLSCVTVQKKSNEQVISYRVFSNLGMMIPKIVLFLCLFYLTTPLPWVAACAETNNQEHKPTIEKYKSVETLLPLLGQQKSIKVDQGFHILLHLLNATRPKRILWSGLVEIENQNFPKGYCVVTDDDRLFILKENPYLKKQNKLTLYYNITLQNYDFVEPTAQGTIRLTSVNPYQHQEKGYYLTLKPSKQDLTQLLHIIRYATKKYYLLNEENQCEAIQLSRPLNPNQYWTIALRNCCPKISKEQLTLYLCVSKIDSITYAALASSLATLFGTSVLKLYCMNHQLNMAAIGAPINWQYSTNKILEITLEALPSPNPFPRKKIGKKRKKYNLCPHIHLDHTNQLPTNYIAALGCPFYQQMKTQYNISETTLFHMSTYDHLVKASCRYGTSCYSFVRLQKGIINNNQQYIYDQCHMITYHHPPRGRENHQQGKHIFAYEENFAQIHHIDLRNRNPLHPFTPHLRYGDNDLRLLVNEVVSNGYVKDLILDQNDKQNVILQNELIVKMISVNYITSNELPLLVTVNQKLQEKKHVEELNSPLDKVQMCALLLYTGGNCNHALCKSQREGDFIRWKQFDRCLMSAILALHRAETKTQQMLYSGLANVKFDASKVHFGFLKTYTSSSWNRIIAHEFINNSTGILMHITPAMQAVFPHCDVSWISRFPRECEMLFARSADIGLMAAPKWKGKVIDYDQVSQSQVVSFTPAAQELIVRRGEVYRLAPNQYHSFSYIKLEPYATLTTHPYNVQTKQGGYLMIHCYGACILEEGARIHVNGLGYPGRSQQSGIGEGGGFPGNHCAGGGSHQTAGKAGEVLHEKGKQVAQAGKIYQNISLQKHHRLPLGSGGGAIIYRHSLSHPGARGGGVLSLKIDGDWYMGKNAAIQADGEPTDWHLGGAGSGGSLRLECSGKLQVDRHSQKYYWSAEGGSSSGLSALSKGAGGKGQVTLCYTGPVAPQFPYPQWLDLLLNYWTRFIIDPTAKQIILNWSAFFLAAGNPQYGYSIKSNLSPTLHNPTTIYADYCYHAGLHAYQQKNYRESVIHYNETIQLLTQQKEQNLLTYQTISFSIEKVYIALGKTLEAAGQYYEAMQAYEKGGEKAQSLEAALTQLQYAQTKEVEIDYITQQGLSLYIPLQAADQPVKGLHDKINTYPFIDYINAFTGQPFITQSKQTKNYFKNDEKKDDIDDLTQQEQFPQQLKKRLEGSRVLLLQGASGAGKSLSGRYMTTQYRYQKKANKHGRPQWVALFIPLSSTYNGTGLINQAFIQKGLNLPTIKLLQQSQKVRFLFILDGFDEIITAYRGHTHLPEKIYERFGCKDWKGSKLMISCRSQGITDHDKGQYLGSYPEVHLVPFDQKQIRQYINAFAKNKNLNIAGWKANQYHETLYEYPGLTDMTCEPFSLRLMLNVLPHLSYEKGTQVSRTQLYETFTNHWFQGEINRLKKHEKIPIPTATLKQTFQTYCEDLALAMFKSGQQVADAGQESSIWQIFFTHTNRLSLQSSPLRKISTHRYMFIHKSYQEYFVASRFICNLLDLLKNQSKWNSYNFNTIDWNQKVYQSFFNEDPAVVNFMLDRLYSTTHPYNQLEKLLFAMIDYSKRNQKIAILAANSSTLLCAARVSLGYQKWAGIQIPNAKLDEAFLCGTDFSGSDCTGVSFRHAYLERTQWQGAKVDGVTFGEFPYLQHDKAVNVVVYSPNAQYIASASDDKTIRIWNAITGNCMVICKGHTDKVYSVAWAQDSQRLASASADKTVRVWNIKNGKNIATCKGHTDYVYSVSWAQNGSRLASGGSDQKVYIWNPENGKRIAIGKGHKDIIYSVAWSEDSNSIASGSYDKTVRIWDTKGRIITICKGHTDHVKHVAWAQDNRRLASASYDKTVRIWDTVMGETITICKGHSKGVHRVSWSKDNSKIASASKDKTLRIWETRTGTTMATCKGHTGVVNSIAWAQDNRRIASASYDKTVRIWDATTGNLIATYKGHTSIVWSVAWAEKTRIASASKDNTVRIWEVQRSQPIASYKGHTDDINSVDWSSDNLRIASASKDKSVRIWNAQNGQLLTICKGHNHWVQKVIWAQDNRRIASVSKDNTIRIWNATTGKTIVICKGHTDMIWSIAWSPNNTKIASASKDNTVRIWNPTKGNVSAICKGHTHWVQNVAWSSDNRKIASSSKDKTVRIWDAKTGKILAICRGHIGEVYSVAWAPNGSMIASASADNTIRTWNSTTGNNIFTCKGHTKGVNSVTWAEDNSKIASASKDNSVRIWNPTTGKSIATCNQHTSQVGSVVWAPDSRSVASCGGYSSVYKRTRSYLDNTVRIWNPQNGQPISTCTGHTDEVYSLAWAPDSSSIVSASGDNTLRIWNPQNGAILAIIGMEHARLSLTGATFHGAIGLSKLNQKLIKQRGGIVELNQIKKRNGILVQKVAQ